MMVRSSQANNSFDTLLRKLGKMVITMIAIVIMKITMTLVKGMLMGERRRNLRSIEMEVTKMMMVRMMMMVRRRRRKRPEQHRDGGDEHDEVAGCQHIRWH